ncbi:Bud-site selection protein [Lactifluus subvellereus]|nr:Bud-site selection protein [Lactifluus subvellereus]
MHFSTNSRGMKRKLSTDDDSTKMIGKLFHGLKEIKKAAKKAKAFETRKIVKKLKASGMSPGEKGAEILILEVELDALKRLDHDRIGATALKSKLKKDKFLSSEPAVQSAISKVFAPDATPTSEGMAIKLERRLLSSKTLSREVNTVISSLNSPLKLGGDNGVDAGEDSSRPRRLQKARATPEASESNAEHSIMDHGILPETDALGSVGVPDQELGDSVDSDDTNSGSGSATSTLPSGSHSSSDRAKHSPLRPNGASESLGDRSVFLPTLSNGFIPGGSDTDWSDAEANVADGMRKNRRGQRARRAIWEKKYGKGAKHLQKRDESGATHDRRTFRRHVPRSQASPRSRFGGLSKQNFRGDEAGDTTKKHISYQQKSRAVDDRPLHPSWVAKMRMKERASAAIVPSQGKRIKFDD